jgi:hypothetical protein
VFIEYWNYTSCIHCGNHELIEQALTQILEREGCRRIPRPPQPMSTDEIYRNSWKLLRNLSDFWLVGLFVGTPGWTIVKTAPNELFCRRAKGADRPRLSELAMRLGCDAFHWGVYDSDFSILLEADTTGRIFISGEVDRLEEEKNYFYDEQINQQGDSRFLLLNMPDEIRAVVKPSSPEEIRERERRLEELEQLQEQEENRLNEWQMLSKEERERRLNELRISEEEEPSIDIQFEMSQVLRGNAEKTDQALAGLLGGSPSYWHLSKNNLYYLAYTKQQQLEADGARLLYFQPAEHYRKLDPLSEIEARY